MDMEFIEIQDFDPWIKAMDFITIQYYKNSIKKSKTSTSNNSRFFIVIQTQK
jgi:hypothetical protein